MRGSRSTATSAALAAAATATAFACVAAAPLTVEVGGGGGYAPPSLNILFIYFHACLRLRMLCSVPVTLAKHRAQYRRFCTAAAACCCVWLLPQKRAVDTFTHNTGHGFLCCTNLLPSPRIPTYTLVFGERQALSGASACVMEEKLEEKKNPLE